MSACPTLMAAPVEIHTRLFGTILLPIDSLVIFPDGLPGFTHLRAFALLPSATDGYTWLLARDEPDLALLLVDPARITEEDLHLPEPLARRARFCGAVVTLPSAPGGCATANLQAPVVVDRAGTGRQIILPESPLGVAHPFRLETVTNSSPARAGR